MSTCQQRLDRMAELIVEIKRISEKNTKGPSDLLAMVRM